MVWSPKQKRPESPIRRGVHLSEEESNWKKNLKGIFDMFDKTGDGEISLFEMQSELCSLPNIKISEESLAGINKQFKFMDLNLDGSVTFPEFYSAITASMKLNHKTLQKEKEISDFGFELFTLMALYQRHKLREQERSDMYEIDGEPLEAYLRIKNAKSVSLLPLDLMREIRNSNAKSANILEKQLNQISKKEEICDRKIAKEKWKKCQEERRKKWEEENKEVKIMKLLHLIENKEIQARESVIDRVQTRRIEKEKEKLARTYLPRIRTIPNSINHCFSLKPIGCISNRSFRMKNVKRFDNSIFSDQNNKNNNTSILTANENLFPEGISNELTRASNTSRIRNERLTKLKKSGARSSLLFVTT